MLHAASKETDITLELPLRSILIKVANLHKHHQACHNQIRITCCPWTVETKTSEAQYLTQPSNILLPGVHAMCHITSYIPAYHYTLPTSGACIDDVFRINGSNT